MFADGKNSPLPADGLNNPIMDPASQAPCCETKACAGIALAPRSRAAASLCMHETFTVQFRAL